MKQLKIIKLLKSIDPDIKIDQPMISRILQGKENVTYPMAICLHKLSSEKSIKEWREQASYEEIREVFNKIEKAVA